MDRVGGKWGRTTGRVQLTDVLEGCLSFRKAGTVIYEVASIGFGLTNISETNKKCDQAVVLLILCSADFLWALHHMVLELNSYLALVWGYNQENTMTGISKFHICCYKIGVFRSGFAWEIRLISNLGMKFQLSFFHN